VYVRMTDPDAPTLKRPHSDSSSCTLHDSTHFERDYLAQRPSQPLQQNHQQPCPPCQPQPSHHNSPSSSRPYSNHGPPQPPPPYPIANQGQLTRHQAPYPGFKPSPSLLPSDTRAYSDLSTIPLLRQHSHSVTAAPPVDINKDTISTYPSLLTPQSISASDASTSLPAINSVNTDVKPQPSSECMEYEDGYQNPSSVTSQHRPNGSVTNSYSHTTSPHNDQGFHPPPLRGQQYGQPTSSHALKPYTTQHPGSAAQKVRRKQVRATQACNHCRTRKQRCNEARPCQFCRENNFDCQYKYVPPPK
jgi:hypothetical protein